MVRLDMIYKATGSFVNERTTKKRTRLEIESLAHWVERPNMNRKVPGSNPGTLLTMGSAKGYSPAPTFYF